MIVTPEVSSRVRQLIQRHRHKGILVDTNLLLLFLVASFDTAYARRFRRTQHYRPEDYVALVQIIQPFDRIIVTPSILTEISNLADDVAVDYRYDFCQFWANLLISPAGSPFLWERQAFTRHIIRRPEFPVLGLTDTGIIDRAVHDRHLVVSHDQDLCISLAANGVDVITFEDVRPPLMR